MLDRLQQFGDTAKTLAYVVNILKLKTLKKFPL